MADEQKERSDLILQGATATWEMNIDGNVNGTYRGTFKFKCYLTPTETLAAGRAYRELLGANPAFAPDHESFLAYALTQLKYRVLEAPPFWTTSKEGPFNGDLADENVISEVLLAATDAEIKYKAQLNQRKKDALERAIKAAEKINSSTTEEPDESTT